jgi:glycosyltransferase involved in cell wall biosynthesis
MAKNIAKNNKTKPAVTVVMSVYNGEKYLKDAVDSILTQTFEDFEFIIINDGSKDNTLNILKSYNDPRIVIISRENRGLVASLNEGINKARGKYIARQDADDISHPDRIKKQYDYISIDKDIAVLGTYIKEIDLRGKEYNKRRVMSNEVSNGFIETSLLSFNPIAHGSAMFSRQIFLKSGSYQKDYWPAEDYELWSRMSVHGKLSVLREKLYSFRVNPKGISLSMPKEQRQKVLKVQNNHISALFINKRKSLKSTHDNLNAFLINHGSIWNKIKIFILKKRISLHDNSLPNIIIFNNSKSIGGGEIYTKQIVDSLKDNYNITVLITKELFSKMQFAKASRIILLPRVINIENRIIDKIRPYLYIIFTRIKNINNNDILHSQQLDEMILSSTNIPSKIFTMHSELIFSGPVGMYVNKSLKLNDTIICVSLSLLKILKKHSVQEKKIQLVYNAVDDNNLKDLEKKQYKNKIIWVGRLEKQDKNPIQFIDIARDMSDSDLSFVMYGDGSYRETLEKIIIKENMKNISIVGFVKDKRKIYEKAMALCITSKREAMPLNMLEAFASGVPVISTDVGDAKKIFNSFESGLIANSTKEFVHSINKVLDNRQFYSKNAREAYLEKFRLEIMIKQLAKIYDESVT